MTILGDTYRTRMAKRGFAFHPSAIALPGISSTLDDRRSKKAFVESHLKETPGHSTFEEISTRKVVTVSKPLSVSHSFELVDEKGTLLPPKIESSLEHLTKSRPRSPGRRIPTTFARRKSRDLNIETSELYDYTLGVETAYGTPPGSKQSNNKLNFEDSQQQERVNSTGVINTSTSLSPVNLATTGELANSTVVKPVPMSALQTNTSTSLFTSRSNQNNHPQNGLSSSSSSQKDLSGMDGYTVNAMSNDELMRTKATLNGSKYGFTNESESNSDSDDVPPPPPPIPPPLNGAESAGETAMNQSSGPIHKSPDTRPKLANNEHEESRISKSTDITGKSYPGHSFSDLSDWPRTRDLNRTSGSSQSDTGKVASFSKPISPAVSKPSIWQAKDTTGRSTSDRRRRFKPVAIPSASEITDENESLSKTLPETKVLTNNSSDKLTGTFPGISTGVSLYDSWLLSRNSKESGRHQVAGVSVPGNTQATPVSTKSDFEKARDVFISNNESIEKSEQQGLNGRKVTSLKASNPKIDKSIGVTHMLSSKDDVFYNVDQEMEHLDQPDRVNNLLIRNLSLERSQTPSPEPPVVIEYDTEGFDGGNTDYTSGIVHHSSDQYMKQLEGAEWLEENESFEDQTGPPSSQFVSHLGSNLLDPGVVIEYDDGSDLDDLSENLDIDQAEEHSDQPTMNFPSKGNDILLVDQMGKCFGSYSIMYVR